MCPDLELLLRILVDERRPDHAKLLDPGRQRNRTSHLSAGRLCCLHDLARRLVEHLMVIGFEANADPLTRLSRDHCSFLLPAAAPSAPKSFLLRNRGDDAGADGAAPFADG